MKELEQPLANPLVSQCMPGESLTNRLRLLRRGKKLGTSLKGEVSFDDISDLISGEREQ